MKELPPDIIQQAVFGARSSPATRAACEQLYRHYEPRVARAVGYAAWRRRQRRQMSDLCQEVWCRLLEEDRRRLRAYDSALGSFGSFISTRAYHEALGVVRLRRMRVVNDADGPFDEDVLDVQSSELPARIIDLDLFDKLIASAKQSLSDEDLALLTGHHLLGRSCRELAQELGIPEARLHKRNERLKKKLGRIVDQLLEPGGRSPRTPTPSAATCLQIVVIALVRTMA